MHAYRSEAHRAELHMYVAQPCPAVAAAPMRVEVTVSHHTACWPFWRSLRRPLLVDLWLFLGVDLGRSNGLSRRARRTVGMT